MSLVPSASPVRRMFTFALGIALALPAQALAKPTMVVSREDIRGVDDIAGTKNVPAVPSNRLHELYVGVLFGGKIASIVTGADPRAAGWAVSLQVTRERSTPELGGLGTWSNMSDGTQATGHIIPTGLLGDSWDRFARNLKAGDMLTFSASYMESHTTGSYTYRGNRAIAETAWRDKGPNPLATIRIKVLPPDIPIPDAAAVKAHVDKVLDQAHDDYPEVGNNGGWWPHVGGEMRKVIYKGLTPNEEAQWSQQSLQGFDDRLAWTDLTVGEELACGITINGVTKCEVPVHARFEAATLVKKLAPRILAARQISALFVKGKLRKYEFVCDWVERIALDEAGKMSQPEGGYADGKCTDGKLIE